MTFILISAEERAAQYPDTFEIGSRHKREQLRVGMFAKLIFAEPEVKAGRQRTERAWVKISDVTRQDGAVLYVGELVDDMYLDIETGTVVDFGPQHVCEWSTHY